MAGMASGTMVRSDPLFCDIFAPLDASCEPCLAGQFDTREFDTVSDGSRTAHADSADGTATSGRSMN